MNPKRFGFLAALFFSRALMANTVNLNVVDADGKKIGGAETNVTFQSSAAGRWPVVTRVTNEQGFTRSEGTTTTGFDVRASKAGHYSAEWINIPATNSVEKTIVLPSEKAPIPLFARRVGYRSGIDEILPAENQWLGYDFQAGDWIAPYGKGTTTDIRFRYRHEFRGYDYSGARLEEEITISKEIAARDRVEWTEDKFKLQYGQWAGDLEISFPGPQEGLVEVVDRFLPYSQLKMPHEAPTEGYGPGWKYSVTNFSPVGWRDNAGFFLRTRVKLDERGNLVSAHYAKVIGDFRFSPQGRLAFTYYFNPTPNDRNLEFDLDRNLFPKGPPGTEVRDP